MKIVLDTNVLVSGFLSPHGPPAATLRSVLADRLTVCFDERILSEYREVPGRPGFGFDERRVDDVLEVVEANGERVLAEPLGLALPDPGDAMFVEVAVAAGAECLVTGNEGHFPASRLPDVSVLAPRAFLDVFSRRSDSSSPIA